MSSILYYSNFCKHSSNIIQILSRSTVKNDIHFVCIDKREKMADGQIALILENNQKVILPTQITEVPALMLLNQNYRVIFGDDILNFLEPRQERQTQATPMVNNEPSAFSLSGGGALGVVSDQFSFLDMTSDDLSAKGNGGTRQMYNYATLDLNDKINTPDEDYTPNKVGDSDLQKYENARNSEIKMSNTPPQPR
tara:strand:- start:310 stop:894 length:585 start_codon:yes stop_codon:yes gene_type:complete